VHSPSSSRRSNWQCHAAPEDMARRIEFNEHQGSATKAGCCGLTLPSRGCPKGCAFCAPLMSNVRCRTRLPAVQLGASRGITRTRSKAICSPAKSEPRTGKSSLRRTATFAGHATIGKFFSQGVSLVVAAHPTAGRSPVAAQNAICRSPSGCQTRMGSGTLRLVKVKLASQSNTKVSRLSPFCLWLGRGSKGSSSNAAPNHSIEGTA
jgi:hypothetical protein